MQNSIGTMERAMLFVLENFVNMAKLMIFTQVHENYGDASKPYWKAKGGNDYVVKKFQGNSVTAAKVVMDLRDQIEHDSEFFREHIIAWEIVDDSFLTQFEKDQLEYEGKITYPAKELA